MPHISVIFIHIKTLVLRLLQSCNKTYINSYMQKYLKIKFKQFHKLMKSGRLNKVANKMLT
jgi:hypothetical protein